MEISQIYKTNAGKTFNNFYAKFAILSTTNSWRRAKKFPLFSKKQHYNVSTSSNRNYRWISLAADVTIFLAIYYDFLWWWPTNGKQQGRAERLQKKNHTKAIDTFSIAGNEFQKLSSRLSFKCLAVFYFCHGCRLLLLFCDFFSS